MDKDPGAVWFNLLAPDAKRPRLHRVDEYLLRPLDSDFRRQRSFTGFMLKLHSDLFLGTPGKLLLCAMGLLFATAAVSGIVLYAPFMRRLAFGTLRTHAGRRVWWLDLHNLLGIVTVMWALVVGLTGAINTVRDQFIDAWRHGQLQELGRKHARTEPPATLASLQQAVDSARAAIPGTTPFFLSLPGSSYTTPDHFTLWMRGETALTSRVYQLVMIDAASGEALEVGPLPGYMAAMFLAEPLHFGDYGGLPLKILWTFFTLVTIVVLASGLYLWIRRPRRTVPSGGELQPPDVPAAGATT